MAKTSIEDVRGYRNRNPGNIETGDPWNGIVPWVEQNAVQQKEERFCVFATHQHGIRAIAVILQTYQDRHKIDTILGIVSRWAPGFENDVPAYVEAICRKVGKDKNATIDVHDWVTSDALVRAIIKHELGQQPYTDAMITKGLVMAGLTPPPTGLKKSGTIKGASVTTVAGVATTVAGAAAAIEPAMPALMFLRDNLWILIPVGIVILGAAAYIAYRRWDDSRQGFKP